MSPRFQRLTELFLRRLLLFLAIFCVGCSAQVAPPELNQRMERSIRSSFNIPADVQISISSPKASEFPGYSTVTVTFTHENKKQTHDFLLAKDGKRLLEMRTIDLSVDPYEQAMKQINLAGRPMRGNKDAKVTVVVYDDFQCPYCSRMHQTLFSEVMPSYGDRVKVYYKDFPLSNMHPWADRAAIDSNCLAHQSGDAYWDFADYVHANGRAISGSGRTPDKSMAEVDRIALDVGKKRGADVATLQKCIKDQPAKDLENSVKEGESLGVNATPVLFVNGLKVEGFLPPEELKALLDQSLRDAGQQPPAATAASFGK